MKKVVYLLIFYIGISQTLHAQVDSTVFPVSLSSFEAEVNNNFAKLKWKTICYLTYANFQIQKSFDGATFSTINSFSADRLRCTQPFELVDSSGNQPGNVFYRINAGDIDGNFYYSKIIKVLNSKGAFEILSVYPSMIHSSANIVLSSPQDDNINMKLINTTGRIIKQFSYRMKKGVSNFIIDFGNVSAGNYWISSVNSKGVQRSIAVVKQ